ncbi:carboxypeptidase regulatory-like domain-containing protein [Paenalcaligenes hominis]|nr:hypothetical protein [Paenalcaligenes hominis]
MRLWSSLLLAVCCVLPAQAQELPAVKFYQSTAYICGGIGSDEANAFKTAQSQFPLSLHFGQQLGQRTAFIADIQVVIRDEQDQVAVNINSEGPFCLLDIDPGTYQVYATYEGQTLHQTVAVQQLGHAVRFVWPETPSNP